MNSRPYAWLLSLFQLASLIVTSLLIFPWDRYYSPDMNLSQIACTPSIEHLLGCDHMGRDLLARLHQILAVNVVQIFLISILSCAIASAGSLLQVKIGLWSQKDSPIWAITETVSTIPLALLFIIASRMCGEHHHLSIWIIFTCFFTLKQMLLIRSLFHRDDLLGYWEQHRLSGGRPVDRLIQYGLKTAWRSQILNLCCLQMQTGLVIEVGLSYLGFGMNEPSPSFGNLISSNFEQSLGAPGTSLFVIVIAFLACANAPQAFLWAVSKPNQTK